MKKKIMKLTKTLYWLTFSAEMSRLNNSETVQRMLQVKRVGSGAIDTKKMKSDKLTKYATSRKLSIPYSSKKISKKTKRFHKGVGPL